jgi:hypothetical protein
MSSQGIRAFDQKTRGYVSMTGTYNTSRVEWSDVHRPAVYGANEFNAGDINVRPRCRRIWLIHRRTPISLLDTLERKLIFHLFQTTDQLVFSHLKNLRKTCSKMKIFRIHATNSHLQWSCVKIKVLPVLNLFNMQRWVASVGRNQLKPLLQLS